MYRLNGRKTARLAMLTWISTLLWLVVGMIFPTQSAAQQLQVFQLQTQNCPDARALDFLELQRQTSGDGGKVTVRVAIDASGSARSSILQSAERSGPESFWNHVRQVIGTWCFSPNAVAGGHLDYTVVVNPRSQGGGGFIEISARDLVLADGWTLDIAHGEKLAHVQNIDLANVMVTESPPSVHATGPKGAWASVKAIWGHLGLLFQPIFLGLFVALLVVEGVVYVRGARSWVKPGFRLGRGKKEEGTVSVGRPKKKGLDKDTQKELDRNFGSWDAMEISKRWIQAMKVSQLEPGSLPRVDSAIVEALDELAEFANRHAKILVQVQKKARELGLAGEGRIFSLSELSEATSTRVSGDLEELKNAVLADAKEKLDLKKLDFDKFSELVKDLKASRSEDEVSELAKRYDLSLKRKGHDASESSESLARVRKLIHERKEWARLYAKQQELGPQSLEQDEMRRLRDLTWEHFARHLVESAHERAKQLAEQSIDLFEVFEAGLSNHLVNRNEWWASQEIDRSVDRSLSVKLDSRKSALDLLWAIGAIAPLVGLFGTVLGISRAFGRIQNIQETQLRMAKLSGDINIALSTTIVGLIIGIIAFLSYYWFKGRIEHTGAKVAKYFTDITNRA